MAYPTEVDNVENTPSGASTLGGSNPTHVEHHQQLHAAVDSIAAVLGTDPDIGYGTVEDALEFIATSTVFEEQTDSFTLSLAQAGKAIRCNKGSTLTVTVPANASVPIPVGKAFELIAWGAGTVTVAEGSGVQVESKGGLLSLDGQYANALLRKVDTNTWYLVGDLA